MINPSIATGSEILWKIPDGKKGPIGCTTPRPAAKGDGTLFYYATRLLAERHKYSSNPVSNDRIVEKRFSLHRKRLTALDNVAELFITAMICAVNLNEFGIHVNVNDQHTILNLLESAKTAHGKGEPLPSMAPGLKALDQLDFDELTCAKVIEDIKYLNEHESINGTGCLFEDTELDILRAIFKLYSRRTDKGLKMSAYILSDEFKHETSILIHKLLLMNSGIDLKENYASPPENLAARNAYYGNAVQLELVKHQGFVFSDFLKDDSFETFFKKLSTQGPTIFTGFFGTSFHEKGFALEPETHHGIPVRYWEDVSTAMKKEIPISSALSRPIVVVGAKADPLKPGGGAVFYYDPADKSTGKYPEKTAIYSVSYEEFGACCLPQQDSKPISFAKNKRN